MFPNPPALTEPRHPRDTSKEASRRARKLGFKKLRPLRDLRGSHETILLDSGVPVHVVAARCGHDPATLLRSYAKRTKKADTGAPAVIGNISRTILGNEKQIGPRFGPAVSTFLSRSIGVLV
jgi:integrase